MSWWRNTHKWCQLRMTRGCFWEVAQKQPAVSPSHPNQDPVASILKQQGEALPKLHSSCSLTAVGSKRSAVRGPLWTRTACGQGRLVLQVLHQGAKEMAGFPLSLLSDPRLPIWTEMYPPCSSPTNPASLRSLPYAAQWLLDTPEGQHASREVFPAHLSGSQPKWRRQELGAERAHKAKQSQHCTAPSLLLFWENLLPNRTLSDLTMLRQEENKQVSARMFDKDIQRKRLGKYTPKGCLRMEVLPRCQAATSQLPFSFIISAFPLPCAGGSACASEGAVCHSPSWLLPLPWLQLSACKHQAHGGASHCSPPSARCETRYSRSLVPWLPLCNKTSMG